MELNVLQKKGVDIQKEFIGIFFEDINYGADGGIYAEMIENRSFEFVDARGDKDNYQQIFDGLYGWNKYPFNGNCKIEIRDNKPQNQINPHYLHVKACKGEGVTNKAYDGLYIEQGKTYHLKFWARCNQKTDLKIAAVSNDHHINVFGDFEICGEQWKQYKMSFTANFDARKALFAIVFENDAEVDFDCISLFPSDAVCGLFRKDLTEKLEELHPGFIRFPGGCVVEGNELDNRYQWKNTVGPIEERKANWNRWAVHENSEENHFTSLFSHYNQTLGLGYFEYFILCEYLGAKALPVANVGLACQYQSTELVKRDAPEYQDFIQDVLDLIEFANGDISTKWGKLRADMGHEKPFHLEMIGIGNEQWQTEKVDFFERYDDFEKAIHEKYPEIKLIGSAGPTVHTPTYEAAWKNYYAKCPSNPNYTYAVDEHYYMEPDWFINNTHFYDKYDRCVKVFSGEYAAHDREVKTDVLKNNWKCALSEAAFLTGVERNADVVYLSSYAPLFARIGYTQWAPDLIWFDDNTCYGTPSYYIQKLFREYTGSYTLESELQNGEENKVFHIVSYNPETGHMFIKLINASDEKKEITIDIHDKMMHFKTMDMITMQGDLKATNSVENPTKIAPLKKTLDVLKNVVLDANTVMILDLH